ncbi:uncharacterized protein LOC108907098 isoform X2 [Anoplophora glabripennis]|nr:uncharacterized protein LOC108907098 isoform X2 [Anoplophora glabripennis]
MAAGRDIKAGQLILKEKPTLMGPQLNGPLICFGCCKNVRSTGYIFCRNCNKAVLCSPKCTGNLHTAEECLALKEANINGETLAEYDQIIFPLRCILLKKYNVKIWDAIKELEPHLEERRDTQIWRRHKVIVEQRLREANFITEEETKEELVQTVCGITDVNTFEVRPPTNSKEVIVNPAVQCLRGLYLEAALMAHDCVGNTHLSVDDDFVLTIHASVDIPEDSPIFFNYTNVLQGTTARRQHLREGKYFECICTRCKDVNELGTDISALKCYRCRKGLIRLINPEQIGSDWECNECKRTFCSGLMNLTVEEGRRRIQDIDPSNLNEMENLLTKLSTTFHSNHYLLLELKQNIAGLYLRLPSSKKNLLRKITLCQELLEVFSKIEPGLSRMKALTLYELQSALADLAHKQYRDKEITSEELVVKLSSAEGTLKEAIKHLLYEPPKSPEGKIAQRAMSELKMLRSSITSIQGDVLSTNNESKLSRRSYRKVKEYEKKTNDSVIATNNHLENDKDLKENRQECNDFKASSKRKRNKRKKHIE